MSKYDVAYVFTKRGNLSEYLNTGKVYNGLYNGHVSESGKAFYAKEREIRLVASFRWENIPVSTARGFQRKSLCYCRIKCPVNPLPVKGEFEVPSIDVLCKFLTLHGWSIKEKIHSHYLE